MWWVGSEVHVYVTPVGAAVRPPGGAAAVSLEAASTSQAITAAFEAVKAHPSKARRVRLWLSGAVARPFMLTAVAGLRDRSEALSMAQAQAPQLTNMNAPCEVWLDVWQAERDCLAVAVERSLLEHIAAQADRRGIKLLAISPAWNAVLTQALNDRPQSLLAIQETGALTLLKVSDQGILRAGFANPPPERVAAHIQRTAIGWATPLEKVVLAEIQKVGSVEIRPTPDVGTATPSSSFAVNWRRWADDETTVN